MDRWKSYKYKNTTIFIVSLIIALLVSLYEPFHTYLLNLGALGYFGAFIAGLLFVSTFTVATGAIILLVLAERLSPVELGLIAGVGAVVGDFIIYRFVKDTLAEEVTRIYDHIDGSHHIERVLHTKYFSWTLPVIGAIIIATPLPDEIGVSLMGISKMKTYQFLFISFILNALGIFMVVTASNFLKP